MGSPPEGMTEIAVSQVRIISSDKQHAVAVPAVFEGPGHYIGCFQDHPQRDFKRQMGHCGLMTPAQCNAMCKGYAYYAVQASSQCFCGEKGWKPRYQKASDGACNRPCVGDLQVMCGGPWHNSVYKTGPVNGHNVAPQCRGQMLFWKRARAAQIARTKLLHHKPAGPGTYVGCFQDHPGPPKLRLLPVHVATNPQMTIPLCSKLCSKYEYYGVRSHSECSCAGADWLPKYGKRPQKLCNAACSGNPATACGGMWQDTVFRQLPASDTAKLREEIKQNLLNVNPVIKVPPTPAILHPMPVCPTCEQAVPCPKMECPACPAGPKDKLIQDLTKELKAVKATPKHKPAPIAQPVKMVQDTEHSNKVKDDNVKDLSPGLTTAATQSACGKDSGSQGVHMMWVLAIGGTMFGLGMLTSWSVNKRVGPEAPREQAQHEREQLNNSF